MSAAAGRSGAASRAGPPAAPARMAAVGGRCRVSGGRGCQAPEAGSGSALRHREESEVIVSTRTLAGAVQQALDAPDCRKGPRGGSDAREDGLENVERSSMSRGPWGSLSSSPEGRGILAVI